MPKQAQAQVEVEQPEVAAEEVQQTYEEVDKLQSVGIQAPDITKLKSAGVHTIQAFMMRTRKELCEIKGLSEAKVDKIKDAVQKLQNFGFETGIKVLERRQKLVKITTGSEAVDTLLGGGIETGSITEVFGEFRTGKTQLSHTLCVTAQLPRENNGGDGKVLYIDTEGTFRPERIREICQRFEVDDEAVLENISVARAYTSDGQSELLTAAAACMIEERYALLVVDSATALFRVDYIGRGTLADRQNKLGSFLSHLTKMAEEFGCAVFITNQVVADPGAAAMFAAAQPKPIGGHIMAHASTTRLALRKGKATQRICKIYDSPSLPESEAIYEITEGGISDPKD